MKKIKKVLYFLTITSMVLTSFMLLGCSNGCLNGCFNCNNNKNNQTTYMSVSTDEGLKSALTTGGNYILTADISSSEGYIVETGKSVVIDLNNHKIVCSNEGASVENKGTLNIKNGTIYSTNIEAQGRSAIKNSGIFTAKNMTLGSKNSRGNAVRNLGTATLTDCVLDCCDNYINTNGYAYAVGNTSGTMTLNNCSYVGSANGVFGADGGSIIVNGGQYHLNGTKSYYIFYMEEGTITVNSGIFSKNNSEKSVACQEEDENLTNLVINGGTISYKGATWSKPQPQQQTQP